MKQGQGRGTFRKQDLFFHANALGMKIAAVHPKLAPYPFWLFDGNCGSGWNDDVGVIGSPITAHLAADKAGLSVARRRFHFCDRNRGAMLELQDALYDDPAWASCSYLHIGDNEEGLALFAEVIANEDVPQFAIGAVIVDPNGWFHRNKSNEGPPINELIAFACRFPRVDIVLNLNLRTYWLCRGRGYDVPTPQAVLDVLHRRCWLVGWIRQGDSRFWVAVGRNVETSDHRSIGLHHLVSDAGREVMLFAENGRQEDMFDAPSNAALSELSRISHASGVPSGAQLGNAPREPSMPLRHARD